MRVRTRSIWRWKAPMSCVSTVSHTADSPGLHGDRRSSRLPAVQSSHEIHVRRSSRTGRANATISAVFRRDLHGSQRRWRASPALLPPGRRGSGRRSWPPVGTVWRHREELVTDVSEVGYEEHSVGVGTRGPRRPRAPRAPATSRSLRRHRPRRRSRGPGSPSRARPPHRGCRPTRSSSRSGHASRHR